MAAPAGNQFWKLRSSHGRNPIFSTPEKLWDACVRYFEWTEANPLREEKVFNGKEGIVRADIAKMRAMTLGGLCVFLNIGVQTWHDYRRRKDFSEVTTRAESVIYAQKFEGAAANMFNANIIARDLGLADRKEHSGPGGAPVQVETTSARDTLLTRLEAMGRRTEDEVA